MSKVVNYSALRKRLQKEGEVPPWFTTAGLQLFYEKYSYNNETVKSRFKTIAETMAKHAPVVYPSWWSEDIYTRDKNWEEVFFNIMWDGYVSCSTPMLANAGLRKRGTTVSCSSGYVGNNLFDRYDTVTEASILTKHSHGTSYSVDDWPCEGQELARGRRSDFSPTRRVWSDVARMQRSGIRDVCPSPLEGEGVGRGGAAASIGGGVVFSLRLASLRMGVTPPFQSRCFAP